VEAGSRHAGACLALVGVFVLLLKCCREERAGALACRYRWFGCSVSILVLLLFVIVDVNPCADAVVVVVVAKPMSVTYGQRPSIMLIEPGVFLLRLRSRAAIGCADDAPVRVVGQRLGDADVVDNCVVVGHGLDDESAPIRLRSRGVFLLRLRSRAACRGALTTHRCAL